ncbi:MAG: hypothetical protein QM831_30505 [Kofleriaceae bacterium]
MLTLAPSAFAEDDKDKSVPLDQWSAYDQMHHGDEVFNTSRIGWLSTADMFADKLGVLGRVYLVDACFKYSQTNAESAMAWAVCGDDAKALDVEKAKAELGADSGARVEEVLEKVKSVKEHAMAIGDAVEKNKDDKGVAAVLKVAADAKAEWAAYASKNADQVAMMRTLFSAVRSQKSNNKAFDGCWDKTYPAFSKAVKATKFPWDIGSGDYMVVYMRAITDGGLENSVAATTFAECAYAQHEGAEGLVASVFDRNAKQLHIGPRTHAAAKLLDEGFKPKFSDRSINYRNMQSQLGGETETIDFKSVNMVRMMQTPVHGQIGKVKTEGDIAKIVFKADKVESCLEWANTNRIQTHDGNGNAIYEKTCKKRGMVDNDEGTVEIPGKFTAGLKGGEQVLIVSSIPVCSWTGKAFNSIFGVAGAMKHD